jgi:Na+-transporting methylmalonyl-CoA/oxaloacetate decarboxylase gamma subunit
MSQNHNNQGGEPSDARYIFILFGLIFVVLFFAFLIYFVYGQQQFTLRAPADNPSFEKIDSAQLPIDTARANNINDKTPTPTVATTVPTAVQSTSPAAINPSRYNPRDTATVSLRGRELLDKYFSAI